jgi:hypothetical protein
MKAGAISQVYTLNQTVVQKWLHCKGIRQARNFIATDATILSIVPHATNV